MGGKVLVPVQEQVDRLIAARLQCDIMGTDTLLVARTDADSATLLDSNADPRDHPFIVGATAAGTRKVADVLAEASARGASADDLAALNDDWVKRAGLKRYPEAVEDALRATYGAKAEPKLREWRAKCYDLSLSEARALATSLGVDPYFDWEAPRSREGFYRVRGGTDYSIARARAYAPHSDLIWMETSRPSVAQARDFAHGIHATHPHQMLAYNLSPSFNWDAAGMSDAEIANFQHELAHLGFTWHFITLAGFHCDALVATELAREYGRRGILAYVEIVQREEHRKKVDVLTHQRVRPRSFPPLSRVRQRSPPPRRARRSGPAPNWPTARSAPPRAASPPPPPWAPALLRRSLPRARPSCRLCRPRTPAPRDTEAPSA